MIKGTIKKIVCWRCGAVINIYLTETNEIMGICNNCGFNIKDLEIKKEKEAEKKEEPKKEEKIEIKKKIKKKIKREKKNGSKNKKRGKR